MQSSSRFIVHGTHITENLLHHKASDVRRILEDKGFREAPAENGDDAIHFHPASGESQDNKQTTVRFGDGGFVQEEDGVQLSGE